MHNLEFMISSKTSSLQVGNLLFDIRVFHLSLHCVWNERDTRERDCRERKSKERWLFSRLEHPRVSEERLYFMGPTYISFLFTSAKKVA